MCHKRFSCCYLTSYREGKKKCYYGVWFWLLYCWIFQILVPMKQLQKQKIVIMPLVKQMVIGKTKILTILLLLSSNNPQCAYTSTNNVSCGNACAPDNTVAVSYKELAKLCEIEWRTFIFPCNGQLHYDGYCQLAVFNDTTWLTRLDCVQGYVNLFK